MSQSEKAQLYNELKAAGVQFDKHYREYNTQELGEAVARLRASRPDAGSPPPEPEFDAAATAAAFEQMAQTASAPPEPQPVASAQPAAPSIPRTAPQAPAPLAHRNPNEMAGERQNSLDEMEPIRVDPVTGFVWYQEEVLKPAFPKPRGRRVMKYLDTGTKQETVKNGDYIETFEVSGDLPSRPAEVKITLPSYQVGIYRDRRFPFRIHTYNGRQGFDLFEVQKYYGGAELVPQEIKRVYVENVLCYDIRTVIRAIQTEHRQLQLQGKVK
jgi:hypothetical protein